MRDMKFFTGLSYRSLIVDHFPRNKADLLPCNFPDGLENNAQVLYPARMFDENQVQADFFRHNYLNIIGIRILLPAKHLVFIGKNYGSQICNSGPDR